MRSIGIPMLSATVFATGVLCGAPASAYVPSIVPQATPSPTAAPAAGAASNDGSASPLHEIAHVRATTTFCSTLRDSTAVAADSALEYEDSVLVTIADIVRLGHADNYFKKHQLELRADDDLVRLTDLSRKGGAELDGLRALAAEPTSTPDQRKALLGLRDALDGAKSRQHFLTKKIAGIVGSVAERPPASILDVGTDNFLTSVSNGDTGIAIGAEDKLRALLPGNDDQEIQRDLGTASQNAQAAVFLGKCEAGDDEGSATPAPR